MRESIPGTSVLLQILPAMASPVSQAPELRSLDVLEATSTMAVDPTVSKEQKTLEECFRLLGKLDYDGAKMVCEREKDMSRFSGSTYLKFVTELVRLCTTEKLYHSLDFLEEQRWFTRREGLKEIYATALVELGRIGDIYTAQRGGTAPGWERKMASLCSVVGVFIKARRDLLDIYSQLASSQLTADLTTAEALVVQVLSRFNANYAGGLLDPLKELLSREVHLLQLLLQCQLQVSNWQFLPSLFSLRTCQQKLKEWHGVQCEDKRFNKRSVRSSFSLAKFQQWPLLYQWLCKFYLTLVAKFSFYFHQTLSEQCPSGDMKTLLGKADFDIISRLSVIRRRSDLLLLALIYNSRGAVPSFSGHGYRLPECAPEPPVGLASYPAVLAFPTDYPRQLWPAIISLMQEHTARLSSPTTPWVKFVDPSQSGTLFFLGKADSRMYLVAAFSGRKVEKESSVFQAFVEVLDYLRLSELFASLRSG